SDNLARGQSTFMVEMIETANILNTATNGSLILLDEVGRGTATFDGLSIAWAVAEHLAQSPQHRAKAIFATHYHELTKMADSQTNTDVHRSSLLPLGCSVPLTRKSFAGRKGFFFAKSSRSSRLRGESWAGLSPQRREAREENAKDFSLVAAGLLCVHRWFHFVLST